MRCAKCGTDNREGRRFCADCGAALSSKCPKCGGANEAREKFCGECGAALGGSPAPKVQEPKSAHARVDGERRHLTVLFCDLVGSTEIAARLDPEEWRETVAGYHRGAAEAIERFGGYVAKYLGDGVMAYFGWPAAHDNDAERAARAGLAILDAISKLNEQPGHAKLAARVGIDSGAVVVGVGAGTEADVFGDAPNIAARVEAAAEPGTVLITEDTHRLVSGLFVVEGRGAQVLKGIERPIQLHRVIQPSGARGRFEAASVARGLTPFVGREDEMRLLLNRWERVRDGEGQVVTIIGEAGIGKSRLVQHFRAQIAGAAYTWLECATAPFFQNTPFYAIAEMVRQSFRWEASDGLEQRLRALETALGLAGVKLAEAAPLIAGLLELPMGTRYPPSSFAPEQQRKQLLATLVAWTLGVARAQPLVIAIEDLHWADPSTLELTQLLVEQGATARLLLLYTSRPEFRAPWPLRAHHTQVNLNRLSAGNVRAMVARVAARAALAEDTVTAVVERTGGVPLFVEELTRAVLESGGGKTAGREIPATLHDSLMARLDRLGAAKEVAQVAAVIGREFSYELMRAVSPMAEAELQTALGKIADAELIYARGLPPDATYQFKHALVRDAAYEALLKSRRKELHRTVARVIDEKFPALKEAQPEVLARHWTEGGETEPAIAAWSRAGKADQARNAFREAQESYQQALALLDLLPESPDRDSRELRLRQSVVSLLSITSGYAAPETIEAVERAIPLAEKNGNFTQLVNLLTTRGNTLLVSGDLPGAGLMADQALELVLQQGSQRNLGYVYQLQTVTRYWRGDLLGAEEHFTEWLNLFNQDLAKSTQVPVNSAVNAFAFGSMNAWLMGRADVARRREDEMIAVARTGGPFEVANAGYCGGGFELFVRNYERAEELGMQTLEIAEKYRLPNPLARARCVLGLARAHLGRPREGIALYEQGIGGLREIGTRMGITQTIARLAEAQTLDGAIDDAFTTLEDALQVNPDELVYRPETLRLRGELRLKQGNIQLADADFREAIALARKMSAKAWELRATMSLARVLASGGHRDQARMMLAEIYAWFTEGFDTRDLEEAKALLDELNSES